MSNEFTMLFILDPGDCPVAAWSVTNQANPPQEIGTMTRLKAGVFKWTNGSYGSGDKSIEVVVKGPTWGEITTKPAGMAGLVNEDVSSGSTDGLLPRWYSLAPYQPLFYNGTNLLKLERANLDHIYHNTFYPTWIPDRVEDGARAVLFAPGFQLFDLGEIQSVTKQYHANTTVIPIMCYGYRRSFVMDLGTTMSVVLKYIRVQPDDFNDASGDSRRWSNGKWLTYLRSLMDRWQMKTNGQVLYLLNPKPNVPAEDPALPMTENDRLPTRSIKEIFGANCYISSAPINYADMGPHAISGNIELYMGTLYPKKETPPMTTIRFRLAGEYANKWDNHTQGGYSYTFVKLMSFPIGSVFLLPEFYPWDMSFDGGDDYIYYIRGWSIRSDDSDLYAPTDLLNVNNVSRREDGYPTVCAMTARVRKDGQTYFMYNSSSAQQQFTVESTSVAGGATVSIIMTGGGGGGASGYKVGSKYRYYKEGGTLYQWYDRAILLAGGAGGGAGERRAYDYEITGNTPVTFTFSLGGGGAGGSGMSYGNIDVDGGSEDYENRNVVNGNPGHAGDPSTISVDGITLFTVQGGGGGQAPYWWDYENHHRAQSFCGVGDYRNNNGGAGGYIEDNYSKASDECYTVSKARGSNGGGVSAGAGDLSDRGHWKRTNSFGNIHYTRAIIASGGGGGGGVAAADSAPSYGGNGGEAWANPAHYNEVHGSNGSYGGGGGGGAAACGETDDDEGNHFTGNGGNGARGYIIVTVVGGAITYRSF